MRKLIAISFILISLAYSPSVMAETIASCSNLKGHAYYPYQGITSEKNSGWKQDQISPGTTELQKENTGYDIIYTDSTKKVSSTIKDDGAKITFLNKSENDFSFLVQYPSGGTDIYRFFKENNGINKFSLMSMRTQIPKNSLMIGDCSYIKFEE